MTHPDRRRYGGLDPAPPDAEETGPARFEADFGMNTEANFGMNTEANFSMNTEADFGMKTGADYSVDTVTEHSIGIEDQYSDDTSADFPAEPTGPAAAGFKGRP